MQQVLFWSKYSSSCKKLLGEMKSYGAMIETVCVDNPKIRKRIATNPNLQITVVPTLLSIYQNGVVEKYEGEKVFQLLYEAFSKSEPIEPKVILETPIEASNAKVTPQEIPTSRETPQENVVTKSKNQELTSLDDLGGDELFEVDETTKEKSGNTGDPKSTNKNLPVKPPSKLAAQAAAIAAAREAHDAKQPRPNANNIPPR